MKIPPDGYTLQLLTGSLSWKIIDGMIMDPFLVVYTATVYYSSILVGGFNYLE
jgi:hypothetical protein